MKMKDSLSSGQPQQQQQQHENPNKGSHGSGGGDLQLGSHGGQNAGSNVAHHSHQHPSVVQNELKLGLGMTGNLGGMMGQMGDKSNQDILKAVSKVNNISFYN